MWMVPFLSKFNLNFITKFGLLLNLNLNLLHRNKAACLSISLSFLTITLFPFLLEKSESSLPMISYKNTHYFKQVDFVTPPIRKTLAQTWEIKRSPPFIWSDADRTADAVLENHYFSTTKFYLIDLNGKNLLFLTSKCMKKTTTI